MGEYLHRDRGSGRGYGICGEDIGKRDNRREEKETVGVAEPRLPTYWVEEKPSEMGRGACWQDGSAARTPTTAPAKDSGSIPRTYVVTHNCL